MIPTSDFQLVNYEMLISQFGSLNSQFSIPKPLKEG